MNLIRNFPFFSLMLPMIAGVITSVLKGKHAARFSIVIQAILVVLSLCTLVYVWGLGESYTFMMGHFPAPWGNEIRVGVLEALMASFFSGVFFLNTIGGMAYTLDELSSGSMRLYFVFLNLLLGSILALIYTNDLFNAYVFIEINTIAACGLIIARKNDPGYVSAARYMIMSQLGSGLFLLGVCYLYTITGHLLMENIHDSVQQVYNARMYLIPLMASMVLMAVGLAIKSGMFPFHNWMPGAYGNSLPTSSAILSGLVSKSYIFLLIKIMYRVIGEEVLAASRIMDILFVFGCIGIIYGSVCAIRQKDLRYMNAYSSVAQIGYIYMGLGMGNRAGVIAAMFHILMHSVTKSVLFLTTEGLSQHSGHTYKISELKGAGLRAPLSGAGFTVGALSMVGIPLFAGFISKLALATASAGYGVRLVIVLIVLAVSTLLNAMYFIRVVLIIYTPANGEVGVGEKIIRQGIPGKAAVVLLIAANFILGIVSGPWLQALTRGFDMFL